MSEFVLIRGGVPCAVCIHPDAPKTAAIAAAELYRSFAAICGKAPVIRTGEPAAGELCLGGRSAGLEKEELHISVADGILWVDGGLRGQLYAATEVLELRFNDGSVPFACPVETLEFGELLSKNGVLLTGDDTVTGRRLTAVAYYSYYRK